MREQDKLRTVKWLADTLELSLSQTYEAVSKGQIPDDCILRIGRRIRVVENRVLKWAKLIPDTEAASA